MLLRAFKGDGTFVAGAFIKTMPILGSLAQIIGCVFVPRSGSKDQLENTLRSVLQRAEMNEEHGTFPPSIIFPEGTCSNGRTLLKFRRGAFYPLRQVIPCTIKYHFDDISPCIEACPEFIPQALMSMSWRGIVAEVNVMPVF